MPKYWKITNRSKVGGQPVGTGRGSLCFLVSDAISPLDWREISQTRFEKELTAAADEFPLLPESENLNQKHVTLLVHGYNVDAAEADAMYTKVCKELYSGKAGLGICVSFDWPSLGSVFGYYPDREHARRCAGDLANVLESLYNHLVKKQRVAEAFGTASIRKRKKPSNTPCKAKVSVISHSMGNYIVQKAFYSVWRRENEPQAVSMVNQLVMVAADVGNDLFDFDSSEATDGLATLNLTYRITSLFSGRDNVLGASAGLKHFGTRRLGRSGLANDPPKAAPGRRVDNVWQVDCSRLIDKKYDASAGGSIGGVHGAYFKDPDTLNLMRAVLRGEDRHVLEALGLLTAEKWP